MKKHRLLGTMIGMLFLVLITSLGHTQDFSKVQIKAVKVKPGIHMLMGKGGNICVSSGIDSVSLTFPRYRCVADKLACLRMILLTISSGVPARDAKVAACLLKS